MRRLAAGTGLEDRAAAELGSLPLAAVELIEALGRAQHRQGREHEAAMRRRRREGRGRPSADAVNRLAVRAAGRPGLEAFKALVTHYEQAPAVLQLAVDGLRAAKPEPFPWADIGAALGVTRQSAWERFGRQGHPDSEGPVTRGAV
jgi:hypothetical protein